MLEIEIFVAPVLIFLVGRYAGMRVTRRFHGGMEGSRISIFLIAAAHQNRGKVGASAKPGFGGYHKPRIHMHGRHIRVPWMGDQRNAGGKKARIFV